MFPILWIKLRPPIRISINAFKKPKSVHAEAHSKSFSSTRTLASASRSSTEVRYPKNYLTKLSVSEIRDLWIKGCGGNDNKFDSSYLCETACAAYLRPAPVTPAPPVNTCHLDADQGKCKAAFPKYFYNRHTSKCEKFTYGGKLLTLPVWTWWYNDLKSLTH